MVGTRSSPGRSSTPTNQTPTRSSPATPKRTRQPRTRIQLATNQDDSEADEDVAVSADVIIAANAPAPRGGHDDSDSGDDGRNNRRGRGRNDGQGVAAPAPGAAIPAAAAGAQAQEDDLENMDWWDNLTAGQQRSMMKRFLIQPPAAAAAAPAPVIVNAPAAPVPRQKMKTLNLADFRGTSAESVEAWLATIPQEVERQAGLGGDTWTAEELYYGVTAHLKDAASMWLITMTEDMRPEDKTLSYLVKKMRKKYGRRDNIFKIQQRLAAREQQPGERLSDFAAKLMDIGFGKRVPAESYVEAFLNGINNQTAAMQIRGRDPRTLEDALQYAEDTCGEYGEGFKVTDWRVAKRRYRDDRGMGAEEEGAPPAKRKASVTSMMEQLDWNKLGFGLSDSAEAPPQFDVHGNPENRMSKAMKADPLSIAALQALILTAGTRHQNDENSKSTASKTKARVLEMKAEPAEEMKTAVPAAEGEDNQQTGGAAPRSNWRNQNAGGSGRRYGGQSNLANYGPAGDQPIQQQKANTNCGYCGKRGHWWRECRARAAAFGNTTGPPQQSQPAAATQPAENARRTATGTGTAAAPPNQENGQRQ